MLKQFDLKVLVVDDSSFSRRISINAFKDLGFNNFHECGDGNEAYNLIFEEKEEFDLILLDWNMPECSGLEFISKSRLNKSASLPAIIMITSNGSKWHIEEAIGMGVKDYLLKPFSLETVKDKFRGLPERIASGVY